MATKPKKKDLEAIAGHELSAEVAARIRFTYAVASKVSEDCTTTLRDLVVPRPNQCYDARLLDVGGYATTGDDGRTQFRLTEFICHTGERFGQPINVVATPLSSEPCLLTLRHTLVNNGEDVEIQVWSWDTGGKPAPTVSFDWRCRVELPIVIL